jgi:hypothetical protein
MEQNTQFNQNNNNAANPNPPMSQPNQQAQVNATPNVATQPNQKKTSSLIIVLIVLLALSGIGGVAAAYHFYSLSRDGKMQPVTEEVDEIIVAEIVEQEVIDKDNAFETLTPADDYSDDKTDSETEKSAESDSIEISTDDYVSKETLCYKIMIPADNDVGKENSCDQRFRANLVVDGATVRVGSSISTDHRNYSSNQDMVNFWNENLGGHEYEIVSEKEIMIGGVPAITVLARAEISKVESEFTFIHLPGRYEAYGYPLTGFSILTTYGDFNNIDVQKQAYKNLLASWQWL